MNCVVWGVDGVFVDVLDVGYFYVVGIGDWEF